VRIGSVLASQVWYVKHLKRMKSFK